MKIKEWFFSKPYWLRGGIIGMFIGIIVNVLLIICSKTCTSWDCIGCIFFMLPALFILYEFSPSWMNFSEAYLGPILSYVFVMGLNILVPFILGSLVGWVILVMKNMLKKK